MPNDGGIASGLGSLAQGFLAGRQIRIQQQQQDLQDQKYEFEKQQQAVTNAQKEEELQNQRETNYSQYGTQGHEYSLQEQALKNRTTSPQSQAQPMPQIQPNILGSNDNQDSSGAFQGPSSADWANAMGAGALNKPPGSGFVAPAQGSQYSTIPSVNAQFNPGQQTQQQPQAGTGGGPPSVQPYAMKMAQYQKQLQSEQDAQKSIMDIEKEGGSAQETHDAAGTPHLSNVKFGPKQQGEIAAQTMGPRSPVANIRNQFTGEPAVKSAQEIAIPARQAFAAYGEAQKGNPLADETIMGALAKSEGQTSNDPNDLIKSQSASQALKDYAAQKLSGNVTDATRQNAIRELQSNMETRTDAITDLAPKYMPQISAANKGGAQIDPGTVLNAPDVAGAVAAGRKLVGTFGPQVPANQAPGIMNSINKYAMGLINPNTSQAAPQKAAPPVGAIIKGHKFLGGDPSQQSSWSKQ